MRTAVTIVSKNYISFARVLAESFRRHHPDWSFIIVLVDEADGYVEPGMHGAEGLDYELVEMRSLGLPDFGTLIYRYTIMELNTAVKPFVLDHLLHERGCEAVAYIDPDILFIERFTGVEDALEKGELCLIPHMRRPFYDDHQPSDVGILQSGTYNLGFCAMRRTPAVKALLDWWMEKLFLDCVVDIPNGLFVDQKWMDMAPGFVPGTIILDDPGYNAAYWNLHEREIRHDPDAGREEGWTADGGPLVFFHFSGYSPYVPGRLSKHQDRHDLAHLPDLRALCDLYAEKLLADGYADTGVWPYAYAKLSNGVALPLGLVRDAVQDMLRHRVPIPDPMERPDAFCEFLMRPGMVPHLPRLSAFQHYLLERRGDLKVAFRNAAHDPEDRGFWDWVASSGGKEEGVSALVALPIERAPKQGLVEQAFRVIRSYGRYDVLDAFPRMWFDPDQLEKFAYWTEYHAPQENVSLDPAAANAIRAAGTGPAAVLHVYFLRGDLQATFCAIENPQEADRFVAWLRVNRIDLDLSVDQITMFQEFLRARPDVVAQMRYLYHHGGARDSRFPTLEEAAGRIVEIHDARSVGDVAQWLVASGTQALPHVLQSGDTPDRALRRFEREPALLTLKPKAFFGLRQRVVDEIRAAKAGDWINFSGYLGSRTGMGESSRSNLALLRSIGRPVAVRAMPVRDAEEMVREDSLQFGLHAPHARTSITVANADSLDTARRLLPREYWGEHRIGYWVWETEVLPPRFATAGEWFDEIWTPSEYSAEAIRATVDTPVHVVPHVVDFPEIDAAGPNRSLWGLPVDATLFGFMFDPKSVLERKNVTGLIDAFLDAVRPEDDAFLVLKSNDRGGGALPYERIKARAKSHPDRIVFLETFLDRRQTVTFMKSLDVYVSLHRSEGFGLTCAEAMACGLPVIASGYSGNLDFMSPKTSRLVETRPVVTERAHGPYPAGSRWGAPDHDDAVAAIREMLDAKRRASVGTAASKAIREVLSVEHISSKVASLLSSRDQIGEVVNITVGR